MKLSRPPKKYQQNCRGCETSTFPIFSEEETKKGVLKFVQLFKERFCGLKRKRPLRHRPEKETAPHDSERCEACQKGACPFSWKTTKIARNPSSLYDSDPNDDDDDYPDWAPPIKYSKVELKTASLTNYVKKSSNKRHNEIVKIRVDATPQEKVTKSDTKDLTIEPLPSPLQSRTRKIDQEQNRDPISSELTDTVSVEKSVNSSPVALMDASLHRAKTERKPEIILTPEMKQKIRKRREEALEKRRLSQARAIENENSKPVKQSNSLPAYDWKKDFLRLRKEEAKLKRKLSQLRLLNPGEWSKEMADCAKEGASVKRKAIQIRRNNETQSQPTNCDRNVFHQMIRDHNGNVLNSMLLQ